MLPDCELLHSDVSDDVTNEDPDVLEQEIHISLKTCQTMMEPVFSL